MTPQEIRSKFEHGAPEWDADTKWPDSALAIWEGAKDEQP